MVKTKIGEKQRQYDALMDNMKSGALPATVVADMAQEMDTLRAEMDALRNISPPEDYTNETVTARLDSLKDAADDKAIHLLIERIDKKNKTDFNITSTLESVLGKLVAGEGFEPPTFGL